jgi:hypothetical protein
MQAHSFTRKVHHAEATRSRSRLAIAAGLLLVVATLTFAPSAVASIVIGQSIAGVKLGASEAQVTAVLGPPASKENAGPLYPGVVNLVYPTSVGLHFTLTNGRFSGVLIFSKKQKTSKGITIGSSRAQLKKAYPQAKCAEGPYGPQSLYCAVLAHFQGRKSFTSFLFGTAKGSVTEIELGYGVGLAQELKEQRKK